MTEEEIHRLINENWNGAESTKGTDTKNKLLVLIAAANQTDEVSKDHRELLLELSKLENTKAIFDQNQALKEEIQKLKSGEELATLYKERGDLTEKLFSAQDTIEEIGKLTGVYKW